MSKRSREKYFWSKYGISNPKKAPETWSHFGSRMGETTDEDLYHFTRKVKSVEFITLGENEVTNEGISYLAGLENLRELDLKNLPIDDACLPHLLKLKSLEWLHIRSTRISSDGVEKLLEGLPNLKTLIFSLEDEAFGVELKLKYPDRELYANFNKILLPPSN